MYVLCALHVLLISIVYLSAFCIPSPCTDAEGEMKCKLYCFSTVSFGFLNLETAAS